MQAVILSIGDELVLGQTVDTNSAWLSAQLAGHGVPVLYHHTLADDQAAIADAVRLASQRAELMLITGGLGPTDDDLTRQALADAMDEPLELDARSVRHIERFFKGRGRPMPERNRVQAMRPRSATMIDNHDGTAPGMRASLGKAAIYVMPGVPREMVAMFERAIEPELSEFAGNRHVILTTRLNTFGAGESTVAEVLDELMDRQRNPKVGTTVSDGIVAVRIRSEYADRDEAQAKLDETIAEVEQRLGSIVFGRDDEKLEHAIVKLLQQRNQKLATAESCTGGLIGAMVTSVAGSSDVYAGGWITYSNAMKESKLHVPADLLESHGAVSEPVVRSMAKGALDHCAEADVSLSITGIAGPTGGTDDKPVGTVWIGLGWRREGGCIDTDARLLQLPGSRAAVRDRSAKCALQLLRLHLLGEPLEHLRWARPPAKEQNSRTE
ncbi:MAG: competence/damage-inducible protein A [bacterium]